MKVLDDDGHNTPDPEMIARCRGVLGELRPRRVQQAHRDNPPPHHLVTAAQLDRSRNLRLQQLQNDDEGFIATTFLITGFTRCGDEATQP